MTDKANSFWSFVGIVFVILFIANAIFYSTRREIDVLVKDKTSVVDASDPEETKSKHLIFTDTEVFEDTDCWQYFKFNSSDFYGELTVGKRYSFVVVGFRIPFLSMYRNIVEYKEIK